jgi:hypothetical protein
VYSRHQLLEAAAEAAEKEHWHVWSLLVRVVFQCFPDTLGQVLAGVSIEQVARAFASAWQEDMAGMEEQRAAVAREREEVQELRQGLQQFVIQGALLHRQAERRGI